MSCLPSAMERVSSSTASARPAVLSLRAYSDSYRDAARGLATFELRKALSELARVSRTASERRSANTFADDAARNDGGGSARSGGTCAPPLAVPFATPFATSLVARPSESGESPFTRACANGRTCVTVWSAGAGDDRAVVLHAACAGVTVLTGGPRTTSMILSTLALSSGGFLRTPRRSVPESFGGARVGVVAVHKPSSTGPS
mmetsp:Transcript_3580/g.14495  ORF Transcript_3580/g.14495 Transcript_3580/m.14495 type:complete len:203 (-) Transcript_3580:542-1150(-)